MVNILISNDDGVNAPGILAAKKALEDLGNVIVVAPDDEHSGLGRSLTVMKPLKINKTKLEDGSVAYGVSGTPSDSVNLGINQIMKEKPDIVIAGINLGRNICKSEITKSGTVGASLEAVNSGIPSIAVSLSIDMRDVKFEDNQLKFVNMPDFTFAAKILRRVVKKILDEGLPEGVDLLNLNIPSYPASDEIKITSLADKMFDTKIIIKKDSNNNFIYLLSPNMVENYKEGTDGFELLNKNCISLTPLKWDMTGNIESLKNW
jgi:5'-nucleotidase